MTIQELAKSFEIDTITIKRNIWLNVDLFREKVMIDHQYDDLIDENTDLKNYKNHFYLNEIKALEIISKLKSHPEHYNICKLFGLNNKFRKQDEIKILAVIYEHYRGQYNMNYQHPELEFKMDTNMIIEAGRCGGLVIEIDENNDGKYNEADHEDRQHILESCGYYFVRIKPDEYRRKELIEFIDQEINNYQTIYSQNIDPEILWKNLKNKNIDKQFFDVIGKSIVCDKTYCVDLDDIVNFTGYSRKDHAKNFLIKNMRKNQDYVDLKLNEIEGRENIIFPRARGNKNKRFIFLTKFAFYSFIMMANTTRAKNIRMQMIDIYNTYHDLLMYCRSEKYIEKYIEKNADNSTAKALVEYKERQENKFKSLQQKKSREIKGLKGTLKEIRRQKDNSEESVIILKHQNKLIKEESDEINEKYDNAIQKLELLSKFIKKIMITKS